MSTYPTTGLDWFRSSYSGNGGQCVEVARGAAGVVPVRDSKDTDRHMTVSRAAWDAFLTTVK